MRRAALIATALLAGCSMEPKLAPVALPVPPSWPAGDAYLRQTEATLPAVSYRDIFRDPRLQRLIEQAIDTNRDLRIAAANIAAARAQYRIVRANRFPQVDASGRASYSDGGRGTSTITSPGGGGGNAGTGPGTGTGVPGPGTGTGTGGTGTGGTGTVITTGGGRGSFAADVGVTAFELDLFGRLASLSRAQQNRFFATEAAARATRLTLVGDVADAWLTYAADRSLLLIAEQTVASAERSVRLTRARLRGGIAPRSDLRQAEQIQATAQSDLALQRTAIAQDVNLLRQLVGQEIDPALLPGSIEQAAPTLAELPAGLDSRVLLRRPDVVQAEYELRAANAEIGAARAALFPSISLTGLVGFASNALGALFSGDAFNYSGSAGVNFPIFRAGAGRANVALTRAQRDAALAGYEQAIQIAFREVSDGLARRGTIAEQLRADTLNSDAAADTFRLAEARYRGGIDTFLASLDAQRSLYQAQRTLATTRLTGASNLVTLYRSLGGDALIEARGNGPRPIAPPAAPLPTTPGR